MINLARVENRAKTGGHNVPAGKIEDRRKRSLSLVRKAIKYANRAYFFDNSGNEQKFVAEFENARPVRISRDLPSWFLDAAWDNASQK